MEALLGLIFIVAIIVGLIVGGIQTFQRNWVVALLLLIFITPIWTCWAIVEIFLPKPVKQPVHVVITHQYK